MYFTNNRVRNLCVFELVYCELCIDEICDNEVIANNSCYQLAGVQ